MNHDFDHHRAKWPIRRVQDWVQNGLSLTVACGLIAGGIKIVRLHSRWMDRVLKIEKFDDEFEDKWARKISDNTVATQVLQQKVDDLKDGQEDIKRLLLRRLP